MVRIRVRVGGRLRVRVRVSGFGFGFGFGKTSSQRFDAGQDTRLSIFRGICRDQ
jgi:hypothetical protein